MSSRRDDSPVRDDYLWDRSGPRDPEVARLEALLGRFAHRPAVPAEIGAPAATRPRTAPRLRERPGLRTWAVAAAGIAAALLVVLAPFERGPGYRVAGVSGVARVFEGDELAVAGRRATLFLAGLGEVDLEPGAQLGIVSTGEGGGAHALRLHRGRLRAWILAAPRRFQIDTPAGLTIDLGCEYTLAVGDDGVSELEVHTGQVAFAFAGREVYVPAGASCRSLPERGPTAPVFGEIDPARRAVVERFAGGTATEEDLALLLELSSRDDALPLFALLTDPSVQRPWRERIAALLRVHFHLPPEAEVPTDAVLDGDPEAREAWLERMRPFWARGVVQKVKAILRDR